MRQVLIAAHGNMASSLKKSINMIYGKVENLTCMDLYAEDGDNTDYDKQIQQYFDANSNSSEIVICTDIQGGSVSQKFLPYCNRPGVHMITGVNLPVILEMITDEDTITRERMEEIVNTGRQQLDYVNAENFPSNEEDDFF